MIKINLAKKKKTSGGVFGLDLKALSPASFFPFFKRRKEGLESPESKDPQKFDFKNSPIVKAAIAIGIAYFVEDSIQGYKKDAVSQFEKKITSIENQITGIQTKLNKIKGFEIVKKQLEEDEKTIRSKLEILNIVLQSRDEPSKMLLHIAQNIPEEVWLTEIQVKDDAVNFAGATPGYTQVSDLLKALNESSFFSEINLRGIEETTSTTREQRVQTFQINAKKRRAL